MRVCADYLIIAFYRFILSTHMFDYKSNNVKHFVQSVVFRVIYMQQVVISNMTRLTRNYDEGSLDPIIQTYRPWTNRRTSG